MTFDGRTVDDLVDLDETAALDDQHEELFDGDLGTLDLPVRNTLVTILRTRYLSHETHPREWDTLMAERGTLLSRLHDLLIDLHIDENTRTAFKIQARTDADGRTEDDEEGEALLRTQPWTVLQAALLIGLRERYHAERGVAYDLPVLIEWDDLMTLGTAYVPEEHRDEKLAATRVRTAIEALVKARILRKVYAVDGTYRISPVIESLLPVDVIRHLSAQWQAQAAGDTVDPDTVTPAVAAQAARAGDDPDEVDPVSEDRQDGALR